MPKAHLPEIKKDKTLIFQVKKLDYVRREKVSEPIIEKIEIVQGNIVDLYDNEGKSIKIEAIVNAAKPTLMGGSGVDGAIHKAVNERYGSDFFKEQIKINLDEGIKNAKEDRIRCNTSEVVITDGYGICDYIFHTVGPIWDGGSKSCLSSLQICYENIINEMINKYCSTIAIPIISSGSYGFAFDLAAKIQIVTISNYLIKLKNRNGFQYDQIKKIYLVVYIENNIEQYKTIFESYRKNICNEKKSYYETLKESEKSYELEIKKYDYTKRGYFGGVRSIRLLLIKMQKLFFITYFFKNIFCNKSWEDRRKFIDIQVFFKMLFPIISLILSEQMSDHIKTFTGFVVIILMLETFVYILHLIFLADIQNPSANVYRSIILLFTNYIELTFGFAFLYNIYKALDQTSIKISICFAFTNSNANIVNDIGFILVSVQSVIMVIFSGLIFAYFVNNFKQREFY